MPIRAGDLRTLMLRVSADARVGAALKNIAGRSRPADWLLLYPLPGGYAVTSVAELARRSTTVDRLLDLAFADLGLLASPTVDIEAELAEARALQGATGWVVVLRDDEPYGVLVRPAARPPARPPRWFKCCLLRPPAGCRPPAARCWGWKKARRKRQGHRPKPISSRCSSA